MKGITTSQVMLGKWQCLLFSIQYEHIEAIQVKRVFMQVIEKAERRAIIK